MRTERGLDVASQAEFGVKLHRPEVLHILRVEEHVTHHCLFLVHLQRVTSQNYALEHHSQRVWWQHSTGGYNLHPIIRVLEHQNFAWCEHYRAVCCHNSGHIWLEEAHKAEFVATCAELSAEVGPDPQFPEPTVHLEECL